MNILQQLEDKYIHQASRTAVIHGDTHVSYGELYESCHKLANVLIGSGLTKGDRVAIFLEKTPEAIISFLGVAASGGIAVPIDHTQPLNTVQYVIDLIQPTHLMVDRAHYKKVMQLNLPCGPEHCITVGDVSNGGHIPWHSIMSQHLSSSVDTYIHDDDIAYLNFTSGTTGVPKGAMTTHANIYWNTRSAVERLGMTKNDVHICLFPAFLHSHELFARSLYLGGTAVLVDSVFPKTIINAISQHGVTCMMGVAPIWEMILRQRESCQKGLEPLRLAESGGMHISDRLSKEFKECFGLSITPVWGSTETNGIALAGYIDGEGRYGSMGKPCPYYEVAVLDKTGHQLPPGEAGEMVIRGPGVCRAYFNNDLDTGKQMRDGWFYTGDIVQTDDQGYFYFIDRKARMIKVAGMKVYPLEIEQVLNMQPMIEEVVVAKDYHTTHGEVPKALVVLKEGASVDKAELRKFCENRLSKYKVPRSFEFCSNLPKTSGGKILWREVQPSNQNGKTRIAS